ncbi:hypothetical protein HanIR_Chr16g0831871 [Helianthus annuus]|nr:hypothetical protein HanIR_Chr16g0831871 [Helianthus annuus]
MSFNIKRILEYPFLFEFIFQLNVWVMKLDSISPVASAKWAIILVYFCLFFGSVFQMFPYFDGYVHTPSFVVSHMS